MGNLQTGLSFLLPILMLFLGWLLNKQIPDIWRASSDEPNSNDRIVARVIIIGIFMATLLIVVVLFILGVVFIQSPDLPDAQPLNISLNINSPTGTVNITNLECTPSFSCEKFCPPQNCPSPTVVPNNCQSCNLTKIYNPLFLTFPKM